jgi:hypothetical protein
MQSYHDALMYDPTEAELSTAKACGTHGLIAVLVGLPQDKSQDMRLEGWTGVRRPDGQIERIEKHHLNGRVEIVRCHWTSLRSAASLKAKLRPRRKLVASSRVKITEPAK